jgi:hypothetical protein
MCADAYDAEPAREPSPTPAPRLVVLICHSTLATLMSAQQPHPLSIGGFRPVHGSHSGGFFGPIPVTIPFISAQQREATCRRVK